MEKTLKAFYIRDNFKTPPKTHDLVSLAEKTKIVFNEKQILFLDKVNTFQLEVRYPDYKSKFYKICNKEFAKENLDEIRNLFIWLKSQII